MYSRERFVKTTKAQKATAKGKTLFRGADFFTKVFIFKEINRPRDVKAIWMAVNVIVLIWQCEKMYLFKKMIPMEERIFIAQPVDTRKCSFHKAPVEDIDRLSKG